jgi:hypothetical protein
MYFTTITNITTTKCCIYCDGFYNTTDLLTHQIKCKNIQNYQPMNHHPPQHPPPILSPPPLPLPLPPLPLPTIPSQTEMFKMILDLTEKVELLTEKNKVFQKEINNLKNATNRRFKRDLLEYLQNFPPPKYAFKEWLKQTFSVDLKHLYLVFENDLIDGMKSFLEDKIKKEGIANLPIRFFKEKPDNIFIYTTSPPTTTTTQQQEQSPVYEWKMCLKTEFSQILDYLNHEFMKTYYTWQKENEHKVVSFDEKDIIVAYSLKINGGNKAKQERTRAELQKWFLLKITI